MRLKSSGAAFVLFFTFPKQRTLQENVRVGSSEYNICVRPYMNFGLVHYVNELVPKIKAAIRIQRAWRKRQWLHKILLNPQTAIGKFFAHIIFKVAELREGQVLASQEGEAMT